MTTGTIRHRRRPEASLVCGSLSTISNGILDHQAATSAAPLRFLRRARNPIKPRPGGESGSAPGKGPVLQPARVISAVCANTGDQPLTGIGAETRKPRC